MRRVSLEITKPQIPGRPSRDRCSRYRTSTEGRRRDLSERTHHTATDMMLRLWRHWPGWVGYVAASWSLIYGALGLWWRWAARITRSQAQTTPKQWRSRSCGAQVGI